MVLKIVKIVGISLGALFLLLFGIAFSKVDKNSTNKLKDAFAGLFKKKHPLISNDNQPLLGNVNSKSVGLPTTTPKVNTPVVIAQKVNIADKLGFTYEGQPLYKKYNNGSIVTAPHIGYLTDGTLIGTYNAIFRDGEYKKIILADTGVVQSSYIDMLVVDGLSQKVYGRKTGVNLQDYLRAIGFLESGIIVYQRIVNVGETSEYSYYGT